MTAGTQTCARCGGDVPGGSDFCQKCGASLKDQARASVALERVRIALAERYPVIRRLGEGGMATVYLARDDRHNRDVAVKVLRPEIALGVGPERFQREISVAGSLQHPHILSLYDSGEIGLSETSPPVLYYVMPYVNGESLRDRLERTTQLPLEEAVQIAKEVAGALDYAHRQGVVHRDIKPENILLSEGHAQVADFGIAAAIGAKGDARITDTGIAIGTPAYMSPEQASGGQMPDGRSDIYSLGCVLYEMLAGEPPYTGPTAQAVISKRFSEPIPALAAVRDVPEEIDAVIRKSLARVPADRFATAGQMVLALGARRSGVSAAVPAHQFIATSGVPARPAPARRRWITAAAVGIPVLAAVAAALLWRARGPASEASATRVAVMPFAYHGSGSGGSMGGALVPLLSSVLDGVGTLRAVDPSAVLAATGEGPGSAPDPVHARRIASRLGAGRFVVGDIVEGATDQFTITATAYDNGIQVKRATVEGNAHAQMFRMVNDLAVQLLPAFDIRESPRRLESMSTSSIVALNEYLKGESGRRQGNYPAAAEAFGKAVEADSLFALAWFRQAYVLIFSENPGSAEVPMLRALALRERLSARDRRLAEALGAEIQVDPEQADRLYRGIVLEYPDDVEGWFGRGDVMLHFGPLAGLAMDSLSQAFERVLFLDPRHSEALLHLPWAAALDGRRDFVDSVATRLVAQDTGGYYAPVWRIVGGFARGDSGAVSRAVASQGSMDDLQRLLAVNMVATMREPRGTAWLARALLAAPGRQPEARAFGHLMAAHLEMATGHVAAADRELAAADTLDPAAALEGRALIALMPWLETPDTALRGLRTRLERWDAASVRPGISSPWVVPHDSLHPQMRLYLLGALSARLQDVEAAQRWAAALLRFDTTTAQGTIGRALAHEILGDLELARGRNVEGLAELGRSVLRGRYARTWQRAYSSPFFSQSYERFLRARALAALGRGAEAARWYGSLWMSNGFDLAYLAPGELALAEIADRAGDVATALRHYRAFVAMWKDADAPLQPIVARASQRIAALGR